MGKNKFQFHQIEDAAIVNAYDQIVFNILEEQNLHSYKSFLFCGCEPQVGTTSVVTELGILLARLRKRVLIVDADYRRVSPSGRSQDAPVPGMSEYIGNSAMVLTDCIYESNIEGLYVLPAGKITGQSARQILYSPRFKKALQQLKQPFDLILIDSGAVDTSNDCLTLATQSDALALVCALNGSSKGKLRRAYLKLTGIQCNLIGVIENMADMQEYKAYMDHYDYYMPASDASSHASGQK